MQGLRIKLNICLFTRAFRNGEALRSEVAVDDRVVILQEEPNFPDALDQKFGIARPQAASEVLEPPLQLLHFNAWRSFEAGLGDRIMDFLQFSYRRCVVPTFAERVLI